MLTDDFESAITVNKFIIIPSFAEGQYIIHMFIKLYLVYLDDVFH